jgi:hypothetical protein
VKWRSEPRGERHFCSLYAGINSWILTANYEGCELGVFATQGMIPPNFNCCKELIDRVVDIRALQFDQDIDAVGF